MSIPHDALGQAPKQNQILKGETLSKEVASWSKLVRKTLLTIHKAIAVAVDHYHQAVQGGGSGRLDAGAPRKTGRETGSTI